MGGPGPPVSQQEGLALGNPPGALPPREALCPWLGQEHSIDVDPEVGYGDPLSREADHALDEEEARAPRMLEDEHVSSPRGAPEAEGQDVVAGEQGRDHAALDDAHQEAAPGEYQERRRNEGGEILCPRSG